MAASVTGKKTYWYSSGSYPTGVHSSGVTRHHEDLTDTLGEDTFRGGQRSSSCSLRAHKAHCLTPIESFRFIGNLNLSVWTSIAFG